ncbi:MAG: hypothetical protein LCH93_07125 [Proteobacteria bacterium]|nr:hypothetical protein [Pseudomonadota bacterium]
MRLLLLLAVAVAISACSPPPPSPSRASGSPTSTARSSDTYDPHSPHIESDPYSTTIDVKTKSATRKGTEVTEVYGLYSKTLRKGNATRVYVQWSAIYSDRTWHIYNRASNDKGQSYDFQEVERDVGSCRSQRCVYRETYNIIIPLADLKRGATDGIRFKIYARSGDSAVVELPASLIVQFNEKFAEAQKMRAGS